MIKIIAFQNIIRLIRNVNCILRWKRPLCFSSDVWVPMWGNIYSSSFDTLHFRIDYSPEGNVQVSKKKKTPVCPEYFFHACTKHFSVCVACISFPDLKWLDFAVIPIRSGKKSRGWNFWVTVVPTWRLTYANGCVCPFSNWPRLERFKMNSGHWAWCVWASVSTAAALGFAPKRRQFLVGSIPSETLRTSADLLVFYFTS